MLFSSITFLYFFLPAVIIIYYIAPKALKNAVLLVFSLIFYFWGEPRMVFLFVFSIISGYLYGLAIDRFRGNKRGKVFFILSLIQSIGLLVIFKYTDFIITNINALIRGEIPLPGIVLPIGISFYTFQLISYLIDVYKGDVPVQKNIVSLAVYIALFPQLIAGPIVRYTELDSQLAVRTHSAEKFASGILRFTVGLGKKIILANQFGELTEIFIKSSDKSVIFYWIYAICICLQIYYDFSGYSDMAIGIGAILGFDFPENFNYPFISQSITEFWRRWHMTLGRWFRDYVYIPMGGSRCRPLRRILNIAVVWALTGLWHGADWNYVIWGLYFAVLLTLEKLVLSRFLEAAPRFIRHIYLLFLTAVSFIIFNTESIKQAWEYIKGLFVGNIYSMETGYYLRSYLILIVIGVIGATPLVKNICKKIKRKSELKTGSLLLTVAEPMISTVLMLICTAYLADGSYNPFLYFRF